MAQKRSIFEEVGQTKAEAPQPQGGLIDKGRSGARGAIRAWLMVLFALVTLMIAVGGMTRLTDSGLSITEWRPVTGAIPPLSAEDWQREFDLYRQIPQYQLMNRGMSLEEFKVIYWWEWGHRQLGRVIGLVWAVGFLWFLARRQIPAGWTPRLLGLGALGGLQGAIGWWMVASGLERGDAERRLLPARRPPRSRLRDPRAHRLVRPPARPDRGAASRRAPGARAAAVLGVHGADAFRLLQILLGALVAGIDAGRNFTDWPLMAGGFLPPPRSS
jgi:heme a synthase